MVDLPCFQKELILYCNSTSLTGNETWRIVDMGWKENFQDFLTYFFSSINTDLQEVVKEIPYSPQKDYKLQ